MSPERFRNGASALHQRGFALIAMLVLAAMITAYLVAIGLNRSKAELANDREDRDMNALRQAKAALIAYAASEEWQFYKNPPPPPPSNTGYYQPGALPCPDKDDDGDSDCTGSTAASMIGRLPWKTLGIEDLRDSSGERLWYALSHDFRKMQCPGANCTRINSDTQGQLGTVDNATGSTSASNVVAVLVAPGLAILGQSRPPNPANPAHNDPANYVESFNAGDGVHFTFGTTALPTSTFNDRLLVITQADLMAAVEPVVAANIERDVVPVIQNYYNGWHVYPFPAPFDPGKALSDYKGDKNQTRGLLPITPGPWVEWDPASVAVTQIAGGTGTGAGPFPPSPYTISPYPPDCSASTKTQISCVIYYTGGSDDRPAIQIQATLRRAGLAFPTPFKVEDAVMTDVDGNPVAGGDYGQWSWTPWLPPVFVPTVNGTVVFPPGEDATVVFQGRLLNPQDPPDGTGGKVTITIGFTYMFNDPKRPSVDWFIQNEWFRQTWYAVSKGFLSGGGDACNPPATYPCLTVNNLRPSYATWDDKRAIVVLAGRSLNAIPRPSTNPAGYFENANLTAATGATLVYENRSGAPTAINDRVVVVSP